MEYTYEDKDEKTLRALLDTCSVFEERRKIRAAIRALREKPTGEPCRTSKDVAVTFKSSLVNGNNHNSSDNKDTSSVKPFKKNSIIENFSSCAERRASFNARKELGLVFTREDGCKAAKLLAQHDTNPFEGIEDEKELNRLLEESLHLEERIKIRRALRKLRDKANIEKASVTVASKEKDSKCSDSSSVSSRISVPASIVAPPTDYSSITDLQQLETLLCDCTNYEERKKIKSALTALKIKTQEQEKPVDKDYTSSTTMDNNPLPENDMTSQTHTSRVVVTLNNNKNSTMDAPPPVVEINIENKNSTEDVVLSKNEDVLVDKTSDIVNVSSVILEKDVTKIEHFVLDDKDKVIKQIDQDKETYRQTDSQSSHSSGGSEASSEEDPRDKEESKSKEGSESSASQSSSSNEEESEEEEEDEEEDTFQSLENELRNLESRLEVSRDFEERREIRASMRDIRARMRESRLAPNKPSSENVKKTEEKQGKTKANALSKKVTKNTSSATLTLASPNVPKNTSDRDKERTVVMRKKQNTDGVVTMEKDISLQNGHRHVTMKVLKSRTPSQSEITHKDTTVETVIETPGGGKYHERNNIITKQKLTNRGSEYFETQAVKEKLTEEEGSKFEVVDIFEEKDSNSVSKNEHIIEISETSMFKETPWMERLETVPEKEPLVCTNSNDSTGKPEPKSRRQNLISKASSGYGSVSESSEEEQEKESKDGQKLQEKKEQKDEVFGQNEDKNSENDFPEILKPMQDVVVLDGESAEFTCSLKYPPGGTISWYKEERLLKQSQEFRQTFADGIAKLVITEVFPDDDADFRCLVTSDGGMAESRAHLTVKDNDNLLLPEFKKALTNQTVNQGDPVVFECHICGQPQPVIKWFKDEKILRNCEDFKQTYDGMVARLEMTEAFLDDTGKYSCLAANTAGEAEAICMLEVEDVSGSDSDSDSDSESSNSESSGKSPEFIEGPCDLALNVGETLTLEAKVTGTPEPEIQWFQGSELLQELSGYKQTYDGETAKLTFTEISHDDSGCYKCLAKNDFGEATVTAQVIVIKPTISGNPPKFLCELDDVNLREGDRLSLLVKVAGTPEPEIKWYQDDKILRDSYGYKQKYSGQIARLTIAEVFQDDSGCYKCVAKNAVGEESVTAKVTIRKDSSQPKSRFVKEIPKVEKAPHFTKHLFNTTAYDGQPVTMECSISAHPEPTITWYKRGKLIHPGVQCKQTFDGQVARLELKEVFPDDEGRYECVAKNSKGEDRASCKLTIKEERSQPLGGSTGMSKDSARSLISAAIFKTKDLDTPVSKMADIDQINDEDELYGMLRKTDSMEQKKKIRARLRVVQDAKAAEMDRRRLEHEKAREDAIKARHQKAAEAKLKQIEDMKKDAKEKLLTAKVGAGEQAIRDRQVKAAQEKQEKLEQLEKLSNIKKEIYQTGVGGPKKDMEEQATFRSTKTETGNDGGKTTTHTTTTTQRSKDGSTMVTKQTRQVTKTGGFGGTNVTISKTSAEDTAKRLSNTFTNKSRPGTSGTISVKTESWNSDQGITKRQEKTQTWAGRGGAMAAFRDADGGSGAKPNFLAPGGGGGGRVTVQRSPSAIKEMLLNWCQMMTREYREYGVDITNFSSSWNNGMAFCALIHHFYPKAFDFSRLNPKNRRFNFSLAFDCAEKMGDIAPLLEVDDMVRMKNPDWKCVFTYVQSFYRRFRESEANAQKAE